MSERKPSDEARRFGRWIARQLDFREMSRADLARKLDMDRGTVAHWVAGTRLPDPESCRRIADALLIDYEEVLYQASHLQLEGDGGPQRRRLVAIARRLDERHVAYAIPLLEALARMDSAASSSDDNETPT